MGSKALPRSGQCTSKPNDERGNWYSHTAGGKCPDGVRVSPGVCSWRPLERVKTVSLKCVLGHIRDWCMYDIAAAGGVSSDYFIYNTSLPVFLKVFASNDVASGGCPPV